MNCGWGGFALALPYAGGGRDFDPAAELQKVVVDCEIWKGFGSVPGIPVVWGISVLIHFQSWAISGRIHVEI